MHDILGELKKEIGELRRSLAPSGTIEEDGGITVRGALTPSSNGLSSPRQNGRKAQSSGGAVLGGNGKTHANRSEAVRDILRRELESDRLARDEALNCIANISFAYNRHERGFAERLAAMQHQFNDLVLSTMHVHLDHDECMETVFLQGLTSEVRQFTQYLSVERGVRHCVLNLVSDSRNCVLQG